MQITFDTQPTPGHDVNEDLAIAGPRFAFVLDGATAEAGAESGCHHGVAWYVGRLGGELARLLALDDADPLPDILATAITRVRALHSITCDLDNPATPSSTVALVREAPDRVDYLVLADSPVVIRSTDGEVTPVLDDRVEHLPGQDPETVRRHRNVEGGFWVAGAKPEAAHQALTGSVPTKSLASVGLFSDGSTRLAERHGMSWDQLLDLLETQGPSAVIARVRDADADAEPGSYPGKPHDDATAMLCRWRVPGDYGSSL
ncbi:MAG: protein phosphatase 2C domain-containing protein [Nocardioidaceae bacterium]